MPAPTTSSSTSSVSLTASLEINALIAGDKWGGAAGTGLTLGYSFPWTTSGTAYFYGHNGVGDYSSLNEQDAAYHYGFNATQQAAARSVLQAWANVANIVFAEVAETSANVGDIRFAWTSASQLTGDGDQAWGWASYPDSYWPVGGDIWISTADQTIATDPWSPGSYNFSALMHEVGHALGLKHPFDGTPVLPGSLDTLQYTVMSYTDAPKSTYYSAGWKSVSPETPMVLDIAAIQYLYGANTSYHTGNDTYSFSSSSRFFQTIWDAGGVDTIDAGNFTFSCTIDLTPGSYSSLKMFADSASYYDGTNNLGIAYGCTIENAIGGSGSDTLTGNAADNRLSGGAGNDILAGGLGNDILEGGLGNDILDGGAGVDLAAYSGNYSAYAVMNSLTGWSVRSLSASPAEGASGTDTLTNMERLQFLDAKIAIDLDGSAGVTARILGAVFGKESLANREYAGIGLSLLDGGMSYGDLMQLALNAKLGPGFSNAAEVDLLYQNLVHTAPSPEELLYWTGTISSGQFSQSSLAVWAADHDLNATNINLVGLQQTGIAYV